MDAPVEHQPGHGVDCAVVPHRRSRTGEPSEIDRGVGVDEGQRDELGEPAGAVLHRGEGAQVSYPVPRVIDVAVHHGAAGGDAQLVRGRDDLNPLRRG